MTDTTKAPKLLPCPFCGGENLLVTTDEYGGFCLNCENCGTVGPPSEYEPEQMRREWNTRSDAALDRVRQESRQEALREALQRIADLKRGHSEDVDEGHEQAYRAIETLITKDQANG
jgi:transcription elongation factor Elf1